MFRLRIVAGLTAPALAGIAGACSASSQAVASCAPPGSHRIAASASAEVYSSGGAVWGCSQRTQRRTKLGAARSCMRSDLIRSVRVAGELTGYGDTQCGIDTGFSTVIVRRLSDGKQLSSSAAFSGKLLPESYEAVTSLALKRDGSVAWIAEAGSILRHGYATEVQRRDRRGSRVLDSGAGIVANSLKLRGSKLTWTHGGATRSATLN